MILKIAMSTDSEQELDRFLETIQVEYDCFDEDEFDTDGLFTFTCTLKNKQAGIYEFLELLEKATGIDVRTATGNTRPVVAARWSAAYVLREHFGLTHSELGRILNCNHATSILIHRAMESCAIKHLPIEKILEKVLDWQKQKKQKGAQK